MRASSRLRPWPRNDKNWGYSIPVTLKQPVLNACFKWCDSRDMENYEADDVIRNSISFHVRIIYIKLDDSKILTNEKWMFHHFHPFKTGCLGFQVAMLVCCRVDVHPQQFNTSPPRKLMIGRRSFPGLVLLVLVRLSGLCNECPAYRAIAHKTGRRERNHLQFWSPKLIRW